MNVGSNTTSTITIKNNGFAPLILSGTPLVAISGDAAFTVTQQPTTPVTPGGETTFVVQFAPTSAGIKTATVSIASNDSDKNPYTFTVTGTGKIQNSSLLWTR